MNKKINLFISISTYKAHDDAMISSLLARSKLSKYFNLFIRLSLAEDNINYIKYNKYFDKIVTVPCPDTGNLNKTKHESNIPALRLFHSIIQSGKDALDRNFDYIIFLNSGSWIFSDQGIKKIISNIENKIFASRVLKFSNVKGFGCEDHFLIINLKNAKKFDIFNHNPNSRVYSPLDFNFGGIHRMLFMWYSLYPIGSLYVYSDLSNSINLYGVSKFDSLLPFNWDYENFFMHSNIRNKKIYQLRYLYINEFAKEIIDNDVKNLLSKWKGNDSVIYNKKINSIYFKKNFKQWLRKYIIRIDKLFLRNWGYIQTIKKNKIY